LNSVLEELTKEGVNLDIKYINVYRAYVESITAALSVDVPAVEFAPDDADNPEDIETQRTMKELVSLFKDITMRIDVYQG
jgi:hypothetical protein